MNKISNFLWGLVFIAIGVIVGLNALEITNIDIFFDVVANYLYKCAWRH